MPPALTQKETEYYINTGVNEFNRKFTSSKGSGITLTHNEIKDLTRILLKETTRKITSQEEQFLNFLTTLMTADSTLMKSTLTPLAKNVLLLQLGLSAGISAEDAAIQKKTYGSGTTALIISNEEMEDIGK